MGSGGGLAVVSGEGLKLGALVPVKQGPFC